MGLIDLIEKKTKFEGLILVKLQVLGTNFKF